MIVTFPTAASGSDLARTLGFVRAAMGEEAIEGFEEFLDDDPTEALPILLARKIDPGEAPDVYIHASTTVSTQPTGLQVFADPDPGAAIVPAPDPSTPYFATLGPDRLDYRAIRPFVEEAARLTGLPVALIDAVIRTESGYRPKAVSRVGALGLMQLMPKTARSLGVSDAFDPRQNIIGGATYLRKMYDRFSSLRLAIAAYNAGPGAVTKHDGVPPFQETQRYVRTVLHRYEHSNLR